MNDVVTAKQVNLYTLNFYTLDSYTLDFYTLDFYTPDFYTPDFYTPDFYTPDFYIVTSPSPPLSFIQSTSTAHFPSLSHSSNNRLLHYVIVFRLSALVPRYDNSGLPNVTYNNFAL
jgi:hypothetical protein